MNPSLKKLDSTQVEEKYSFMAEEFKTIYDNSDNILISHCRCFTLGYLRGIKAAKNKKQNRTPKSFLAFCQKLW